MKISVDKIRVTERIRKEITKIDELAADITRNGLLNPITVMAQGGGEYRLLAGLRRLRAAQALGWSEIEVSVVSPADAEGALHIEISENEQREAFTYSEKMDFAALIGEIEQAKALERKSIGGTIAGRGREKKDVPHGAQPIPGKSRNAIGSKIGMSGTQYDRAKYIAENAPPEVIEQLDKGERTIRGTYDELRAKEKAPIPCTPADTEPDNQPKRPTDPQPKAAKKHALPLPTDIAALPKRSAPKPLSARDEEAIRRLHDFHALPPEGKIAELQRQLREERARAASAEFELGRLKELRHNDLYHMESIIDSLKRQNADLCAALDAANARIRDLEGSHHAT